jgi:GPH family glycoside/pentoside/hexuronide:cation symporter
VERSSLSVARSFGAGIGSMPGQILLPLFVYSTAIDTGVKYLDSNKFFSAVVLIAGFILIIYFASFKMTRERISVPEYQEKANFRKTMQVLLRNRPFIALSLASMLLIAVSMYTQTIYNYLLKNYYNQPQLFSLVTVANYLPMLALMPFMGKFVKRFGKKEICGFGGLLAAATNIILFFIRTPNPYVFLGFCVLSGIGITFFTLEIWALVGDVIDYQELLSKRREEGTSYACFSFTRKIGQTIAGMGSSVALAFIGYNTGENAIIQTNEVIHGMYSIATLVPAAMYLGIFLILTFLYPLSKNKIVTVIDQLKMSRMKVG